MAINGNVNVMFDADDPYFQQLNSINEQYVESNYAIVLFEPADKAIFDVDTITAIKELTDAMWQIPYSIRVDSLTNHQQLMVDGDFLEVSDLIPYGEESDVERVRQAEAYTATDPWITGRLASKDLNAVALFATIAIPQEGHLEAVLEVGEYLRNLQTEFGQRYPGSTIHLNGDVVIEDAMLHIIIDDIMRVNPIVFVTILLLVGLFLRSLMAVVATVAVIIVATGIPSGIHVLLGFELNPITMMASAVIMVLAVADSVHVLTVYRIGLSRGLKPEQAMLFSLQKNLSPVFWTSVTTIAGFLGMNFGDSPPFRDMGNMAAIGVVFAFLATFTVLPAVALSIPEKNPEKSFPLERLMAALGQWVSGHSKALLVSVLLIAVALTCFIPQLKVNDDIANYFDPALPISASIQFARENTTGPQYIQYSLDSGSNEGIHQPEFLHRVEQFSNWLREQPEVSSVISYVDILKRIYQTMNADDPAFYRIPEDSALNAQYLFVYEMSLPPGMDLSRDLTLDRSALKLTVNLYDSDNATLIGLEQRIDQWLATHQPELRTMGASQILMFAHLGTKIIHSMVDGSLYTLLFIFIFMVVALRSLSLGAISMIPNLFPPLVIYGLWALLVGEVNHAAAMTFSICLGLVVDDTIHFIGKYQRLRQDGYSPTAAIEQTYVLSGSAIFITSVTLITGIGLLSLSHFTVNDTMSLMLAGIISMALLFDLFLLAPLLLWFDSAEVEQSVLADNTSI